MYRMRYNQTRQQWIHTLPAAGYHMAKKKHSPVTQSGKLTQRARPVPIAYFGEPGIDLDEHVYRQIETAARLPVAVRAAVMPDGHSGFALPIGGVIVVLILAAIAGVLAGIWPARRASKIEVMEALAYE
mgnify:CR=1 FL=1